MSKQQVLEIPANQTPTQLHTLLNDRIRDLNLIIGTLMSNPADAAFDMANFQIINLADPTTDLGAVNLRTLKRMAGTPAPAATPVASGGLDAYAIVFADSLIAYTGGLLPGYIVGKDRGGTTEEVWVYARGAPLADFTFNVTRNGVNLMANDLTLPAGSIGPVFAIPGSVSVAHGDVILPVITNGGGVGGVSIGLVVKRG